MKKIFFIVFLCAFTTCWLNAQVVAAFGRIMYYVPEDPEDPSLPYGWFYDTDALVKVTVNFSSGSAYVVKQIEQTLNDTEYIVYLHELLDPNTKDHEAPLSIEAIIDYSVNTYSISYYETYAGNHQFHFYTDGPNPPMPE